MHKLCVKKVTSGCLQNEHPVGNDKNGKLMRQNDNEFMKQNYGGSMQSYRGKLMNENNKIKFVSVIQSKVSDSS